MPRCFQIHPNDNVATLLEDAAGTVRIFGPADSEIPLKERIAQGHKVALQDIPAGAAVMKYGASIGRATKPIARGEWVHLHNLASGLDERSGTLDLHSGAPKDTDSAYA